MPVSLQDPINSSIANGVATVFPYQFLIPEESAIAVEVDGVLVTTGFTVSGVGVAGGGNITFAVAPANGSSVVRYRDLDAKRDFDWSEGGDLLASTHDANDDYAIMLVQQLLEQISRAPKVARGSSLAGDLDLVPENGTALGWGPSGLVNIVLTTGTSLVSLIASGGAALIGWIQQGAGAIVRTIADKLWERVSVADFMSAATLGDGINDHSPAVKLAMAAAAARGIGDIECPYGLTGAWHFDDRLMYGEMIASGLRFIGTGRNGRRDVTVDGLTWIWRGALAAADSTGHKYCFDIRQADGTEIHRAPHFENIKFGVDMTLAAAVRGKLGWFSPNWLELDSGNEYAPSDVSGPNYLQGPTFGPGCNAFGGQAGVDQTADFIRACKCFQIYTSDDIEIRSFRTGVYLKGSDNCTIRGSIYGNNRNVRTERSGNFGNNNKFDLRFLGSCVPGPDVRYLAYLEGDALLSEVNVETAGETLYYLNSRNIQIDKPIISGTAGNICVIGPNCLEATMTSPRLSAAGMTMCPGSMVAPASSEYGADGFPGLTVYDPDKVIESMGRHPRVRVKRGPHNLAHIQHIEAEDALPLGSAGSTRRRAVYVTPHNWHGQSIGFGWDGGSSELEDVADGNRGWMRRIPGIDQYGDTFRFAAVGQGIENNDWLLLRIRYKMTSVPAAGEFRYHLFREATAFASGVITASAAIGDFVVAVQVTGAAAGEVISFGAHNNGVEDAALDIAEYYCGITQAAVADATDAASAIARLNDVIARLEAAGIIAP